MMATVRHVTSGSGQAARFLLNSRYKLLYKHVHTHIRRTCVLCTPYSARYFAVYQCVRSDAVKSNIGIRCALWKRHMLLGNKTSTSVM